MKKSNNLRCFLSKNLKKTKMRGELGTERVIKKNSLSYVSLCPSVELCGKLIKVTD
jgi:hypothetical protein